MLLLRHLTRAVERRPATVLLAGAALAAPLLLANDPAASALFPPCPVRLLTGWLCPGCGSLRAAHQLLHGHWAAAFGLNPLMVLAAPFLLGLLAVQAGSEAAGCPAPSVRLSAAGAWVLLGLTLAYTVARNTPRWPV